MVCRVEFKLENIADPGGRAFSVEGGSGSRSNDGFVIRFAGEVRAYRNSCPHTGVSLNWSDNHFFDVSHNYIQCSLHGALFEPLSGHCIWGPCLGQDLQPLSFELVDQQVIIYI